MSFREKTAWLTLCAIIIVTLMFWYHAPPTFEAQTHRWAMLALLVSVGAYLLIELVGYIVLRVKFPHDARAPRDERERLIDLKALRIAYYTFVTGSFVGMVLVLHVAHAHPGMAGAVMVAAFVLSQAAKHAARIVYYRRDA